MYQRLFIAVLFISLLHTGTNASGEALFPFVDGRWSGGIGTDADTEGLKECWALTTFIDGSALTLAKRSDGFWRLRFSNPGWRLRPSHGYDMVAQVDFYPQLSIAAEAKSETDLEIANLEQISLLGLIENGHTIDLTSNGFQVRYDLEGSAKIIERIRNCFAEQPLAERPVAIRGSRE